MQPNPDPRHEPLLANLSLIRILAVQHAPAEQQEDFRQELATRMLTALERGVFSPGAWLRVAARNLAIDWAKGRVVPASGAHELPEPVSPERGPAEAAQLTEAVDQLKRCCNSLEATLLERLLAGESAGQMACTDAVPPAVGRRRKGGGGSGKYRTRIYRLFERLRGRCGHDAA